MGPQVQPKCFRHAKHMRNNWELRKRGYLIRFGHTEALLLKKKDIKRPFFPPCRNWPICSLSRLPWGDDSLLREDTDEGLWFFGPAGENNYRGAGVGKHHLPTSVSRTGFLRLKSNLLLSRWTSSAVGRDSWRRRWSSGECWSRRIRFVASLLFAVFLRDLYLHLLTLISWVQAALRFVYRDDFDKIHEILMFLLLLSATCQSMASLGQCWLTPMA